MTNWEPMADPNWFLYSYVDSKIMLLSVEPPLTRCSATGFEVHDGGCPDIELK